MTKKGIVDPWRVVAPLRPEPVAARPEKQKMNPEDIDMDADLRVTQFYVLRSKHGSIRVDSKVIATEDDALKLIVECFLALSATPRYAALFKEAELSSCVTDDTTLRFSKHAFDEGVRTLIGVLNSIGRDNPALLKKYGISTLLR